MCRYVYLYVISNIHSMYVVLCTQEFPLKVNMRNSTQVLSPHYTRAQTYTRVFVGGT